MKLWRPAIVLAVLGALQPACSTEPARPASVATETEPPRGHEPSRRPAVAPGPTRSVASVRVGPTLDPASVGVLKEALESKDYATRLIAIEAVGDAPAPALLGWLPHAPPDPEHDARM